MSAVPERGPWDSGLQLERTTLAWLRTTLSFATGGMVVIKLLAQEHLAWATVCVVIGVPLAIGIAWLSARRHGETTRRLREHAPLPGGALPAAVTLLAVFVGCAGLGYVLLTG